jgi:hypothetical protein
MLCNKSVTDDDRMMAPTPPMWPQAWTGRAVGLGIATWVRCNAVGRRPAAIRQTLAHSDTRPQATGQPAGDGLQILGLNQISRDHGRDEPGQHVRLQLDCNDYIQFKMSRASRDVSTRASSTPTAIRQVPPPVARWPPSPPPWPAVRPCRVHGRRGLWPRRRDVGAGAT